MLDSEEAPTDGTIIESDQVYMNEIEKRKIAYGLCAECMEPGTGFHWCKSCNAKRFEKEFKNWTSGNKIIDELIQESQLNAVHSGNRLEWIPYEKFDNVKYITRGGFGKIYKAGWKEGYISSWLIDYQTYKRIPTIVALKSIDNSSSPDSISAEFINEVKSYLKINTKDILPCYGITQDPISKDYMMVIDYCEGGNLRDYIFRTEEYISFYDKLLNIYHLLKGLRDIHNVGIIHKDLHAGNILHINLGVFYALYITDLGLCQPVKKSDKNDVYGVLPYVAPELLRRSPYTLATDIYSFGILLNEFFSEEIPFCDVPHDYSLASKVLRGVRPEISKYVPKLVKELIMRCLSVEPEKRPTAKELHNIFDRWEDEKDDPNSELYSQVKESDEKFKKFKESKQKKNNDDEKKNNYYNNYPKTHKQAVYFSRVLEFSDVPLPEHPLSLELEFEFDLEEGRDQETNDK